MGHTSLLPPHNGHQGKLKPLKQRGKEISTQLRILYTEHTLIYLRFFLHFTLTSVYNYLLKDYIIILQFKELLLKESTTLRFIKSKIQTVGKQGFYLANIFLPVQV